MFTSMTARVSTNTYCLARTRVSVDGLRTPLDVLRTRSAYGYRKTSNNNYCNALQVYKYSSRGIVTRRVSSLII